ncbi:uncharacterized protein LOC120287230 [Eucalyptus grandis]|uniref:uncharacterized protein LOC120287230 n=1 Tax=Eucalyptus grandis TaxID=71139 RepID=UPI00192EDBF3|nr:uncharacterized protein LOC120287230 [Eucalyptus grandis]
MASLATHFSAFLFLFPVGLRRLLCSYSLYLKSPSSYRSKPWYFADPRWKNLDLYALLLALPIASFSELFLFLTFSGHPTYRFAFFQQSAAVFLFWALLVLVILKEYVDGAAVGEGYVFVVAGVAFLVEYSVIGKGLAGTWALQAGLNLGTDMFALKGCHKLRVSTGQWDLDVKCALEEDSLRGVALMNLLFIVHAIGVVVVGFGLFGLLSCNRNLRFGDASGPLLAQLESESMLMRPGPEFELE